MTTRAINLVFALKIGLAAANSFAAVNAAESTLQFLEKRVKADPMDSVAQTFNGLGSAHVPSIGALRADHHNIPLCQVRVWHQPLSL